MQLVLDSHVSPGYDAIQLPSDTTENHDLFEINGSKACFDDPELEKLVNEAKGD